MRSTVRTATLALLRELGLTTVFGNPGSTELAFLADWPSDFRYVLGLQESVVVGMADGYAQATGRVAFVNLHSAAGVGHALGAIFTATKNQTPLVITAGQQARSLLALDPLPRRRASGGIPQAACEMGDRAGAARGCAIRHRSGLADRHASPMRSHFRVDPLR